MIQKRHSKTGDNLKFLLQILGTTMVLLTIVMVLIYLFGNSQLLLGVFYGYLLSLVNILFAFYSIKWAFNKSLSVFYSVILGGMGLRFLFLLITMFLIWKFTRIPFTGFVISLVGFYITLQIFEVRYIQKELKLKKALT